MGELSRKPKAEPRPEPKAKPELRARPERDQRLAPELALQKLVQLKLEPKTLKNPKRNPPKSLRSQERQRPKQSPQLNLPLQPIRARLVEPNPVFLLLQLLNPLILEINLPQRRTRSLVVVA